MIELFQQGMLSSILATNNTAAALELLQNGQYAFNDPIEGVTLHAQFLYSAIKHANKEVLQFLLALPVISDINFFKYCGYTPIGLAVEEGKKDLVPLLLTKTDKNFALHMAVKLHHENTKKVLLASCVFKEKFLQFLGLR